MPLPPAHLNTQKAYIASGMCCQVAYKRKIDCVETWFQYAPCGYRCGQQGAYRYIDCTVRDSLGTNFLLAETTTL